MRQTSMVHGGVVALSLAAVVAGYACAANPSGDCAESGTCPPPVGARSDAGGQSPAGGEGGASVPDARTDIGVDSGAIDAARGMGDGGSTESSTAADVQDALVADDRTLGFDAPQESSSDGQRPGPDGATDAARDASASDAPTCDLAQPPSQSPCVVDDRFGVFASPLGSDANAGTRLGPVRTLGRAIDLAQAQGRRVFACIGTYPEKLAVRLSRDATSVYGGFDCSTWAYSPSNRVVVAPALPGYALEVDGLTAGVTFEDIEFDAQDANPSNPGESSIAVFVHGSLRVAFHRCVVVAGKASGGAGGASGGTAADPSNHFSASSNGGATGLDGVDATRGGAGAGSMCVCPGDLASSSGGAGGQPGASPGAGLPLSAAMAGAAGTNETPCGKGGFGADGADALANAADSPAVTAGVLSAKGWAPGAGSDGSSGQPGQGGGGGGDGPGVGAGGGGACGGCGGTGGKAGTGGGSSIAVLSYDSAVAFDHCTLTAHDAGNGGSGGNGEAGQGGGVGGAPSASGCQGGGGGNGAGGNGGQGGPGGFSLGIGYTSTSPVIDGTYVTEAAAATGFAVGTPGTGGSGGAAGAAATLVSSNPGSLGAAGQGGAAQAVLAL